MIIPVILAGGSGTRLWPLSRELYPKQLLDIHNENTMLQNTVLRLDGIGSMGAPILVCNEEHRFMAAEQLRKIAVKADSIILEPIGKNTAPAIALAALKAVENHDDPILLVLPTDHVIVRKQKFQNSVQSALKHVRDNNLIAFGIVPSSAKTGYGYIKKGKLLSRTSGAAKISAFVEKPDLKTAEQYIRSGQYYWNSGMFMFKAAVILDALNHHVPEILFACKKVMATGQADLDFFRLSMDTFQHIPSGSIDYAVMEKTSKGIVIPFDGGWHDLGSFDALWQTGLKDKNENVIKGDVLTHDVISSYISSGNRLVTAIGLENFVIVETKDAILVSPKDRVQDIKKIVRQLKDKNRDECVSHRKVYRPWGSYETLDIEPRFQVKKIIVKPGAKLSLQKHYHRAEHWTVVSGEAIVTKGDREILLKADESTYIPLRTLHRLENPGKLPLELIEVQSGSYLGEDDIARFDDVYGRKGDKIK